MLAAIRSFDISYFQDFPKNVFMENLRCTFSPVHIVQFAFSMKNWSRNINPEFNTSHTGPVIAIIAYHKYPATTACQ